MDKKIFVVDVTVFMCGITEMRTPISDREILMPVHEISNNVVCATSKAPDQPVHTCSLIRAFASRLSIL